VVFAEHNLTQQRIPQVVVDLVNKSEPKGQVLMAGPYEWRVKVQKKGRGGVLAFIPPRYLGVGPRGPGGQPRRVRADGRAAAADRRGGREVLGGRPVEHLAGEVRADDPAHGLEPRGGCLPQARRGVNIQAIGQSTATTAQQDAADLTKSVDDATSMNLGKIKIRAFKAPVFVPEGDRIVTQHDLSQERSRRS
jgi:hypothetical protein